MSNRIVKLPSVESFGRLTPDKWLLLKTLEESAEMVEAGKQYLKASDPTDPSGIGREFDDHANCLACFGVNVGGELGCVAVDAEEHGVGCRFTVGQLEELSRDYGRDAYSVNNPYGRGES